MGATTIEWCDRTLNICRGCDAVSPGCLNCYAARMAARFAKPGEPFDGLAVLKDQPPTRDGQRRNKLAVWTDAPVTLVSDAMLEALSLRKPCKVFVCSMSDLFHADVPFEYIAAWWAFMAASPHVTYQIVTKRAARMREFFRWSLMHGGLGGWVRAAADLCRAEIAKPRTDSADTKRWEKALKRFTMMPVSGHESPALPNVWLLVSAENQVTLDERVPHLCRSAQRQPRRGRERVAGRPAGPAGLPGPAMRIISTHATAATVKRWAAHGSKRLRAKYRHAITVCRVVNRRDAPILRGGEPWAFEVNGQRWAHFSVRFSWGSGYVRHGISPAANIERSRRWWRLHPRRRPVTLGWYGEHHRRGRVGCALHSWADLRRRLKTQR